jgi:hypothetical protein
MVSASPAQESEWEQGELVAFEEGMALVSLEAVRMALEAANCGLLQAHQHIRNAQRNALSLTHNPWARKERSEVE